MTNIQYITTDKAPLPFGHYSQATVHNNTVYVAGQLGLFPDNLDYIGSIEEQTEQALNNVREVLLAAGSDLNHLLTVTIFVTDPNSCGQVNSTYAKILGSHRPARAMITAAALPRGCHVEIVATAAVK